MPVLPFAPTGTGTEAFAPPPPAPPLDPLQPAEGQIEPGNIDLGTRPRVKSQQGEAVRSIGIDGQQVLIPTVSDDGRILTDPEAIEAYRKTGKHLGKFATPEASAAHAKRLSDDQRRAYLGEPGMTFAEPDALLGIATVMANVEKEMARASEQNRPATFGDITKSLSNIWRVWRASDRNVELTKNHVSESASREEAIDRRIAEIEAATGQKLENPERGGYAVDARRSIRKEIQANGMQPIDDKGGIPERQYRIFAEKVQALGAEHPDKAELFDLGSIGAEARVLASESTVNLQQVTSDPNISGFESFMGQMLGGFTGSRRDPLFVGSLFLGPTSAVGKAALTRVVTSGIIQGAYNAGLVALQQPAVQEWRRQIGLESGIVPALEEVGFAFLFGAPLGALGRGVHEGLVSKAARDSMKNIIDGNPKPGDAARVLKTVGDEVTPEQLRAVKVGEENIKADRVAAAGLRVPDDELNGAALKHADDPINEPPPEAIMVERAILAEPTQQPAARQTVPGAAAIDEIQPPPVTQEMAAARRTAEPPPAVQAVDDELIKQVQEAQPQTQHEARMAIADVLETRGNREKLVALRNMLEADPLAPQVTAPPLIEPARLPTVETTRARLEAERAAAAEARPAKSAEPERISAAAIRVGENVYTGPIHGEAFRAAAEAEGFVNLPTQLDEGFVTTTGRYVTREEAFEIARGAGQATAGEARAAGILDRKITAGEIVFAPPAEGAAPARVVAAAETPEIVPNWKGNDRSYVAKHVTTGNTIQSISFGKGLHPVLLAEENGVQFFRNNYVSGHTDTIYAVTGSRLDGNQYDLGPIIGVVKTETKDGEQILNHVVVSPDRRRQGLASRMLDLAQEHIPNLNANKTTELVSAEGAALLNARARAEAVPTPEPAAPVSRDPLDMIPKVGDDGSITMETRDVNAQAGVRDRHFADLVRSCK